MLGHDERRHRGVECVLRPGRALEQLGRLVAEAFEHVRVACGPAALVYATAHERPRVDLDHPRPARLLEGPHAEALPRQREQPWHAAHRAGADRAGAADLEHRLRGAGVAVRAPQRAVGRNVAAHAGATPERRAGHQRPPALRNRGPPLAPALPALLLAVPAREREREVEPDHGARVAVREPLDDHVGRAAVAYVDEPPVAHLRRPDELGGARPAARPVDRYDARYASPYCSTA